VKKAEKADDSRRHTNRVSLSLYNCIKNFYSPRMVEIKEQQNAKMY